MYYFVICPLGCLWNIWKIIRFITILTDISVSFSNAIVTSLTQRVWPHWRHMQFARLDISLFRENQENGSELLIFLAHSDNTQHKNIHILQRTVHRNHNIITALCFFWVATKHLVLQRAFTLIQQRQWKAPGTVVLHWRHVAK